MSIHGNELSPCIGGGGRLGACIFQPPQYPILSPSTSLISGTPLCESQRSVRRRRRWWEAYCQGSSRIDSWRFLTMTAWLPLTSTTSVSSACSPRSCPTKDLWDDHGQGDCSLRRAMVRCRSITRHRSCSDADIQGGPLKKNRNGIFPTTWGRNNWYQCIR